MTNGERARDGRRAWIVQSRDPQSGNPRRLTIGSFPALSLKQARDRAGSLLDQARSGKDVKQLLDEEKETNIACASMDNS